MSESVKVVVKCRPTNEREKDLGCESVVNIDSKTGLCSIQNPSDKRAPAKAFTFDGVYAEAATNQQVYLDIAFPLVEAVTEGYNGTIFAYGQTGCGKTFSMQGIVDPASQRGIIPRAFEQIFDTIAISDKTSYLIHASYLEIYNEDIRDLLGKDIKTRLELKEKPDGSVFVKDLSMHPCATVRDCEKVMENGWSRRAVGATLMNTSSSRSHSIFTIHLERCDVSEDGDSGRIRVSKLNLVDLAGSERQGKTGATGNRLKEATKINLSLSALGNVISALVDCRSQHIPYRDSKLTRLLQDSLGGNTKTLMIACLSPADNNYEETLSTLRYANRAKNIRNKPIINEDPKDAMIREYLEEIARLKEMLTTTTQQQPLEARVVQSRREEEIKQKANAVAGEYEQKMKRMADELEEAKASSDRAAFEMKRMQAEAEEEKRRLKEQHERDEKNTHEELESLRKGKEALTNEMHKLRENFHEEMKKVDRSVSPNQVEAEKTRIREAYEDEMKKMKEELDLVKQNKDLIQRQMETLQKSYADEVQKASYAIQPEQLELEKKRMREEFERETQRMNTDLEQVKSVKEKVALEMVLLQKQYAENLAKVQDSVPKEEVETERKRIKESFEEAMGTVKKELEEVKLVREQLIEKTNKLRVEYAQNLGLMATIMSTDQVKQERKQLEEDYSVRTWALEKELEVLRQAKDEVAKEIALIKHSYNEEIQNAENDPAVKDLEQKKKIIKARFELIMDRVREDLDEMKVRKNFITKELEQTKKIKEEVDEKIARLNEEVDSEKLTVAQSAVELALLLKSFKEDMLKIEETLVTQRSEAKSVRAKEKYDKKKARLEECVTNGALTQEHAAQMMAKLNDDLIRRTEPTKTSDTVIIEDLETQSNTTASMTRGTHQQPISGKDREASVASAQNLLQVKRVTDEGCVAPRSPLPSEPLPTSHAAERRLRELQEQMAGGCSEDQRRNTAATRGAIAEKLRKEKLHAENRKRQIELVAEEPGTVSLLLQDLEKRIFKDKQEEIVAKNKAIEQLRTQNETLKREVRDIQGEFEFDRMDYLDTIRNLEQGLLWYQAVVEKVLPAVRRDSNYVNLEKIRVQSEWDDLNHRWNLPKFTVDKLVFPLTAEGICKQPSETCGPSRGGGGGVHATNKRVHDSEACLDYELRSEDRFVQRLNESARRDPAAAYFKPSRGGMGLLMQASSVSDRRLAEDYKTRPSKPTSSRELRTSSPTSSTVIPKMHSRVISAALDSVPAAGFLDHPSSPKRQS